jgi:hypothetical protein
MRDTFCNGCLGTAEHVTLYDMYCCPCHTFRLIHNTSTFHCGSQQLSRTNFDQGRLGLQGSHKGGIISCAREDVVDAVGIS